MELRLDVAAKGQVQVTKVVARSPAELSGKISVGDLILGVDGALVGKEQELASPHAVQERLHAAQAVSLVLGQQPLVESAATGSLVEGGKKQKHSSVEGVKLEREEPLSDSR